MYISAQQILSWNNQYAADRTANRGALTHIDADDPRGWVQGADFVAPVHTLTGVGYASEGNATFGLTDPMTLWAQQQSDAGTVYPGLLTRSQCGSLKTDPAVDREPVMDPIPPAEGMKNGPEPKWAAVTAGASGFEPKKAVATAAVSTPEPKNVAVKAALTGTETGGKGSAEATSGALYAEPVVQKSPAVDLAAVGTTQSAALKMPKADPLAAGNLQPMNTPSRLTPAAQDARDRYAKLFGVLAARGVRFNPWQEV